MLVVGHMLLLNMLLLVYLVVLGLRSTAVHVGQFGELGTPIVQIREILILWRTKEGVVMENGGRRNGG